MANHLQEHQGPRGGKLGGLDCAWIVWIVVAMDFLAGFGGGATHLRPGLLRGSKAWSKECNEMGCCFCWIHSLHRDSTRGLLFGFCFVVYHPLSSLCENCLVFSNMLYVLCSQYLGLLVDSLIFFRGLIQPPTKELSAVINNKSYDVRRRHVKHTSSTPLAIVSWLPSSVHHYL